MIQFSNVHPAQAQQSRQSQAFIDPELVLTVLPNPFQLQQGHFVAIPGKTGSQPETSECPSCVNSSNPTWFPSVRKVSKTRPIQLCSGNLSCQECVQEMPKNKGQGQLFQVRRPSERSCRYLLRCVNGDHVLCLHCANGGPNQVKFSTNIVWSEDDGMLDRASVQLTNDRCSIGLENWHSGCAQRGHHQYRRAILGPMACGLCSQSIWDGSRFSFCRECYFALCISCTVKASTSARVCSRFSEWYCSSDDRGNKSTCASCTEAKKMYAPVKIDKQGTIRGRLPASAICQSYAAIASEGKRVSSNLAIASQPGKEIQAEIVPIPLILRFVSPQLIDNFLDSDFIESLRNDSLRKHSALVTNTKSASHCILRGLRWFDDSTQQRPYSVGWSKWCDTLLDLMFEQPVEKKNVPILVKLGWMLGEEGEWVLPRVHERALVPILFAEELAKKMQSRYEAAMVRERERLAQWSNKLDLAKQASAELADFLHDATAASAYFRAESDLHQRKAEITSALNYLVDAQPQFGFGFASRTTTRTPQNALRSESSSASQHSTMRLQEANKSLEAVQKSCARAKSVRNDLHSHVESLSPLPGDYARVQQLHPRHQEKTRAELSMLGSTVQQVSSLLNSHAERHERLQSACQEYANVCRRVQAEAQDDLKRVESIAKQLTQLKRKDEQDSTGLKDRKWLHEKLPHVLQAVDKRSRLFLGAIENYVSGVSSVIALHESSGSALRQQFVVPTLERAREFRLEIWQPTLSNMSLDEVCQAMMQYGVAADSVDALARNGLDGNTVASIMRAAGSAGRRVDEVDEILELKAGLSELLTRKQIVHLFDVMYLGLDARQYFENGRGCRADTADILSSPWWTWTAGEVQVVLRSANLHGMTAKLQMVNGCALRLLNKRKDLVSLGISALDEQSSILDFLKHLQSLPSKEPEAHRVGARSLAEEAPGLQSSDVPVQATMNGIRLVRFDEIRSACQNFGSCAVIGQGGFGTVFSAEIQCLNPPGTNERKFAVKRLAFGSDQGETEFLREVQVLVMCKHPSLVPLVGVAIEGNERCLIYPLMKRGNLQERLCSDIEFPWSVRTRVAVDVLRGITYLHFQCGNKPTILHRDLKAQNILIDENDHARISDVGMARLLCDPEDENRHISTRNLVGTFGYICPVFSSQGKFYESSDGFAVGVVLLQLLTGLPAVDPDSNAKPRDLATRMRRAKPQGAASLADSRAGAWQHNVALGLATVGVSLIQSDEEDRMPLTDAQAEIEALLQAVGEASEDAPVRECIICMVDDRTTRFVPCGHMLTCKPCGEVVASQLRCCPLCSAAIEGFADALPTEATFKVLR